MDGRRLLHRCWRSTRLLALPLLLLVGALPAAWPQSSDAVAKARFAVTFARFVQWPLGAQRAAEGAPLRLCVLQNSPALAQAFAAHEGANVGGRRVSIVLQPAGSADCELLFVDDSAARSAPQLLGDAASRHVLTVGAVDGFLMQGGMVELVNVEDALRFDVNLRIARDAGIGLNSQVLKLARRVRE
jgi:hypothetical protein